MTRQEQDNAKVLAFLDHERIVKDHGREFKSRTTASVLDLRDKFHWTTTRTQRAFNALLADGLIALAGFQFASLEDFAHARSEATYWVTKVTVPA